MTTHQTKIQKPAGHTAFWWPALAATLAAMAAITVGALFLIAPVWQPGYNSVEPRPLPAVPTAGEAADAEEAAVFPLDLNTATVQQLTALPGVGESKAQAIVEYRAAHGPFKAPEDVAAVSGISSRMVESWQGLVTAGPNSGMEQAGEDDTNGTQSDDG